MIEPYGPYLAENLGNDGPICDGEDPVILAGFV